MGGGRAVELAFGAIAVIILTLGDVAWRCCSRCGVRSDYLIATACLFLPIRLRSFWWWCSYIPLPSAIVVVVAWWHYHSGTIWPFCCCSDAFDAVFIWCDAIAFAITGYIIPVRDVHLLSILDRYRRGDGQVVPWAMFCGAYDTLFTFHGICMPFTDGRTLPFVPYVVMLIYIYLRYFIWHLTAWYWWYGDGDGTVCITLLPFFYLFLPDLPMLFPRSSLLHSVHYRVDHCCCLTPIPLLILEHSHSDTILILMTVLGTFIRWIGILQYRPIRYWDLRITGITFIVTSDTVLHLHFVDPFYCIHLRSIHYYIHCWHYNCYFVRYRLEWSACCSFLE